MKYFYDLHIHTALSPCGDEDMTPVNIVNMTKLIGLDFIAITDHNCIGNVGAVMEASRRLNGPLVIAGMELETSEEIHILTLFPTLSKAKCFEKIVSENIFQIKNNSDIYGRQLLLDSFDNIMGEVESLLVVSTKISVEQVIELTARFDGVAIPAHIDKPSNGIIAILGGVSLDSGFYTVEVSTHCSEAERAQFKASGFNILTDSDTHYLDTFNDKSDNFLELESLDEISVISAIKYKKF